MSDKQEQAAASSAELKKAPAAFRTILGEKVGMTQVYDKSGRIFGVSVVKAGPCPVMGIKTPQTDGYWAVRLAFGETKEKSLSKAELGIFKAAQVAPARFVREVRVPALDGLAAGQTVVLDGVFKPGDYVDVRGTSKGGGFAGAMKRHHFRGMPGSHGASDKERSPGSLASRRSLGRVLPGQRMAGRMGGEAVCAQKLRVIKVEPEKNLIYINGPVPGVRGGLVTISETVKSKKFYVEPAKSAIKKDKMGNIIAAKKPTKAAPK